MSMTQFFRQLRYGAPEGGDGIKVERPILPHEWLLASSGADLTTTLSTNPGRDKFGTNITGLAWGSGVTVKAGFTWCAPIDYDKSLDFLKLRLYAQMSGGTDTPALDMTAYLGSASTTDLDPTKSGALSNSLQWVEIDLSGNGVTPGEIIEMQVFPEAHSTDAVELWAATLQWKSMIVANNLSDRG